MVIVPEINGRLGNQLHQICSAIGIGSYLFRSLKLKRGSFSYADKYRHKFEYTDASTDSMHEYHVHSFKYQAPHQCIDNGGDIYLKGYNLSYKYHISHRNYLSSIFTPIDEIKELAEWQKNNASKGNVCGIHVRRDDYIGNGYYYNLEKEYYAKCAKLVDNDVDCYIVCSDDIEWCKENLKDISDKPIYFSGNKCPVTDNYLLRLCEYKILSNSSFSFFAAYFGDSNNVYYPSEWMYHSDFNLDDYCLEEWNRIKV